MCATVAQTIPDRTALFAAQMSTPLADPKVRAQIAETAKRIHSTLGQVVLAMAAAALPLSQPR